MELTKKISPKTVYGGAGRVADAVKAGGGKADLFHVIGVAMGTKTGETNLGQWTALRGNFEATHCGTGEISKSPVCFLPDVALDLVLGALAGGHAVHFALLIGARAPEPDENIAVAYVYTCSPLQEVGGMDTLGDLRKLLPAPEKKPKA